MAALADCLVVGGGPAGLTAAFYLRRFLRDVVVVDQGHSRALAIERTVNYPGFPEGVSGHGLLQRLRQQLADVQGECVTAEVCALQREPQDNFAARWNGQTRLFRTVVLATGVVDVVPALPGIEPLQRRGLLRECPICDGYEHRGQRILVLGDGPHAAREAAFIAHYSPHVAHGGLSELPSGAPPGGVALPALAARVEVGAEDGLCLWLRDGSAHRFEVAYAATSVRPRSTLGLALGALVDARGCLVADAHGATSVSGLFAVGDIAHGLDQLVVAAAQGALAATAVHNLLRETPP